MLGNACRSRLCRLLLVVVLLFLSPSGLDARGGGKKKGRDFYKVLGVPRNADDTQNKTAYRKLAMKWCAGLEIL